jgi:hypothetical protein
MTSFRFLLRYRKSRVIAFTGGYLQVFHDVTLNGEHLGTLFYNPIRQWRCASQTVYQRHSLHFCADLGTFALFVSLEIAD